MRSNNDQPQPRHYYHHHHQQPQALLGFSPLFTLSPAARKKNTYMALHGHVFFSGFLKACPLRSGARRTARPGQTRCVRREAPTGSANTVQMKSIRTNPPQGLGIEPVQENLCLMQANEALMEPAARVFAARGAVLCLARTPNETIEERRQKIWAIGANPGFGKWIRSV